MDPPLHLARAEPQSLPPGQSVEGGPRPAAQGCYQPDILIPPSPSHCLNHHHLIPLLSTLCPHCILSPPTYGPGLHPSSEERPLSWSLLQLWQTRPHREGLPRTTHPEHPEHQCYNDSETCS